MRTFFRATCAILLAAAATNCGQLKDKLMGAAEDSGASVDAAEPATATEDSAAPATSVATEEAPAPKASNENDIARFPDETKLDNVVATTERAQSAREVPTTGKVIATLNKGTRVTEIAQRDKYFLVVFDDPKNASTKLMGWIHQDAFTAATVTDAGDAGTSDAGAALKCAAGETQLFGDAPFCGKTCAKDADCASGQVCKGTAHKYTNGKQGDIVPVCTLQVTHDAGTTVPADAGTAAPTDAGSGRPVIKLPSFDGGIIKLRPKLGN